MKKIIILMLVCICLISCNFDGGNSNINNNKPEKDNIDYTTAEKLEGKTFSYFTQDVEAGDKAVLFKKSIGFGEIDKTSNTIALEIKDFKGTGSNGIYDIKTNSIDGKVLDISGLDKIREFDKEFTLDGLVYENCDQKMKWAKLLEGNTYVWTALHMYSRFKFDVINIEKNIISDLEPNVDPIRYYNINETKYITKATETALPNCIILKNITNESFNLGDEDDGGDGNGSKYRKIN